MSKLNVKYMVLGMVSTNVYLAQNQESGEVLVIDPADAAGKIAETIRDMGGSLAAILLTHGHHDHILAAAALAEDFGAPIYAHEAEVPCLADPAINGSGKYGRGCVVTPDHTVRDGEVLELAGFSVQVLHTPGHTAGSCCYYIADEKVLFAGDTLFCGSYGRTDLPTGNQAQIEESVHRLLTELPDEVTVCPGHESLTTIEFEKRYNPLRPRG